MSSWSCFKRASGIPKFLNSHRCQSTRRFHPIYRTFQHLVYDPIVSAKSILRGPYVIVIDGLDECEDKDEITSFIDQMLDFFKGNPWIPLRILITSQVELVNLVDHTTLDDITTAFRALFELRSTIALSNAMENGRHHPNWKN
ncbi:hypothetical protein D9611_008925 [Ephemerocybe angulata]|uniref:Nephrocystin 3-like N-terminal domain-containing protein n=1 Tax=Ephemerocybe angulata TaxID=980116 RepID=A0A8H5C0D3_9AGAR|nr:hypothetical protein D9611_008925 [Tulosesus angulatus]